MVLVRDQSVDIFRKVVSKPLSLIISQSNLVSPQPCKLNFGHHYVSVDVLACKLSKYLHYVSVDVLACKLSMYLH